MWICEAVGRNGGIGVDSSEENLGSEDIGRSRTGGIDRSEDRMLLGNCGRVVSAEDCRVVVVEDCRTGGELKKCSIAGQITHAIVV